jgi:hypothetical protein
MTEADVDMPENVTFAVTFVQPAEGSGKEAAIIEYGLDLVKHPEIAHLFPAEFISRIDKTIGS